MKLFIIKSGFTGGNEVIFVPETGIRYLASEICHDVRSFHDDLQRLGIWVSILAIQADICAVRQTTQILPVALLVGSFMTLGIVLRIARCSGSILGHSISTGWCNLAWNNFSFWHKIATNIWMGRWNVAIWTTLHFLTVLVKNILIAWFYWVQVTWVVTQGPRFIMPSAWITYRKWVNRKSVHTM